MAPGPRASTPCARIEGRQHHGTRSTRDEAGARQPSMRAKDLAQFDTKECKRLRGARHGLAVTARRRESHRQSFARRTRSPTATDLLLHRATLRRREVVHREQATRLANQVGLGVPPRAALKFQRQGNSVPDGDFLGRQNFVRESAVSSSNEKTRSFRRTHSSHAESATHCHDACVTPSRFNRSRNELRRNLEASRLLSCRTSPTFPRATRVRRRSSSESRGDSAHEIAVRAQPRLAQRMELLRCRPARRARIDGGAALHTLFIQR